MPDPRFQFYEVVRVASGDPELAEIHGERGVILGRTAEESGAFRYGVFIYRDEICWDVAEDDLEATGTFSTREALYGDAPIRVRVDARGHGRIAD